MSDPEPVTVCVARTVKPGCEEAFERALRDFVRRSLALPGQLGVHIMRPAPGSGSREYGIIRKFAHREAVEAFRSSPEYREWNRIAPELTEGEVRIEELAGLESWFTPPGAPLRPLPKWKMAVVTLLAVYPTALLLRVSVGDWTRDWPAALGTLVSVALMVGILTWGVMPLFTRAFHGWLYPGERKAAP